MPSPVKNTKKTRKSKKPRPVKNVRNVKRGNMYWPLKVSLNFSTQFPPYPQCDVESAALSIWRMYLEPSENLPWSIYEYKKENRENIIRSRLDLLQCPFSIIRDVIEAAWDGKKMNLKELIKQLKKNYKL